MTDSALPLTRDYLRLLCNRVPMIDVRAPVEFQTGALPFAKNLPLLANRERHEVGICYRKHGQDAAIALGHRLVCGSVKERRVQSWKAFMDAHPDAVLYCARGGLRSKLSQQWLSDAGIDCPRVEGGFKNLRAFLLDYLTDACSKQEFILLSGMTGTGKTDIIKTLSRSIDLERLANHKGSSFGQPLDEQPAQIDFENTLVLDLMGIREHDPHGSIILEDESHNIGGRHLPHVFVQAMRNSPMVVIELDFDERIETLWQEYVVDRYAQTVAHVGEQAEEQADQQFADYLRNSLLRIRKRLGGQRTKDILALMEVAIERQHADGFASHRQWLQDLTASYYDPMYRYQLDKNQHRIAFRGNRQAVMQWLAEAAHRQVG